MSPDRQTFIQTQDVARQAEVKAKNEVKIEEAAKILAQGGLVVQKYKSLGLIIDGSNPASVEKLCKAKGIDPETARNGGRPLISVLPTNLDYRAEIIDFERHTPEVSAFLQGDDSNLLTPEGHALFYRVHARRDNSVLVPPLVNEDEHTKAIVLLWHANPLMSDLENKARVANLKKGNRRFLLTGSSANPTHEKQPIEDYMELNANVRKYIDAVVDLRDERTKRIPFELRDSIPMLSFVESEESQLVVMRQSRMYEPLPAHPYLRSLVKNK